MSASFVLPLVYHPDFVTPLPPGHRFPMPKFGMIYQVLVEDGLASLDQFHCPPPATRELVTLVHTPAYVDAFLQGTLDARALRRIGLPWGPGLVRRTLAAIGGTVHAVELALDHGVACSTAGGTHHAHPDFGSGYCIFNDLAVAARYALEADLARRILIVDLDVHQGDGTAAIFAQDRRVFTLSVHCDKNFPFRKTAGDLDVALPVGADDAAYLHRLAQVLPPLLDNFGPDLVIYDGGVDPHQDDRLGKLCLSDKGLYRRDRFVFHQCRIREIPVAAVVGGGYDADVRRLARRHATLHRAAMDEWSNGDRAG